MQSYPLRLPLSLKKQVADTAKNEGVSLNHFIALAIVEKLSRMEQSQTLKAQMKIHKANDPPRMVSGIKFY